MKTFAANLARTHFAELMDNSRREPVAIAKHGRVVNVLMAIEDYERLVHLEDQWWMDHNIIESKADPINIDQAIEEIENGEFIRADIIKL